MTPPDLSPDSTLDSAFDSALDTALNSETTDRSGYWNDYYASSAATHRPLPSQFAAFVAGELTAPTRVIELGCGNGRDSIFFASYGHDVTGVDGSESAVAAASATAEAHGVKASFLVSSIDDPALPERLGDVSGPLTVYARFFVHAITDREEEDFLTLAAGLTSPGDLLAVEYRTVRDQTGAKVTGAHYRRYVAPATFQARALSNGFEVTYATEGFGFAKYRQDDAYCARELFTRV